MAMLSLFLLCLIPQVFSVSDPRRLGRRGQQLAHKEPFYNPTQHVKAQHAERAVFPGPLIVQNEKTKKFIVNGTGIPDVDFDIGESYAGLLPTSSARNASELYFWFFPTSNPDGKDDLTIWLNGGPGCSSLEGLLQENGPFLWQYGTFKPVKNPYTWVNLTNMVWVEQPVGTGFSQGISTETSEEAVAESFLGFFKNFVETFSMQGKKIYITGESYAGMYVPYIADAMFNKNDTTTFDVQATMIYDPSVNSDLVTQNIPAVRYVEAYDSLFNLNDTTMDDLRNRAEKCGYTQFIDKYLTFPPPGPFPNLPTSDDAIPDNCHLWNDINNAVLQTNPCFDIYSISTTCPVLWDVLGFPGSFDYLPSGAQIYFNRTDVQKAINAPIGPWAECGNVALGQDTSLPSGLSVLPSVIERSKRTIISHGQLDYVLLYNGTLMTIQNMTWGGKQGFQKQPEGDLFVPYHVEASQSTLAGSGIMGVTHTERKLTWTEIFLSGHMTPQYQPTVAYRQLEFLLGRIESLTEVSPFTTQPGVQQVPGAKMQSNSTGAAGVSAATNSTKKVAKMTQAELFGLLVGADANQKENVGGKNADDKEDAKEKEDSKEEEDGE